MVDLRTYKDKRCRCFTDNGWQVGVIVEARNGDGGRVHVRVQCDDGRIIETFVDPSRVRFDVAEADGRTDVHMQLLQRQNLWL
jgi:hypothetical protein